MPIVKKYFKLVCKENKFNLIENNIYIGESSYDINWENYIKENEDIWIVEIKKYITIYLFTELDTIRNNKLEQLGI
jgi:hypothetical protein